jgi:NAD(P)-dependent dehydrogenase (short-subunit alcohol dehydrogenase family)
MSNTKVNGKVAFITGANRGLGLETARELGKQGIVVVLGPRDPKEGEAAAAKLRDEASPQKVCALTLPNARRPSLKGDRDEH